jgi:hypothetical protein
MENYDPSSIEIGRLLRAGIRDFVAGCKVSLSQQPFFGAMVAAPQGNGYQIYGLIQNIRIEDDGLVRQLVSADVSESSVIADNRVNRNVPLEMSVVCIGYQQDAQIYHLLPPRPPLSLDIIRLCGGEELRMFTATGRFGYFRHILNSQETAPAELIAAHFRYAVEAHRAAGDSSWPNEAAEELITILRDDYPTLMSVLSALGDTMQI